MIYQYWSRGLQWARLGRPVERNEAHGPVRAWPIGPLIGQWIGLGWALHFLKGHDLATGLLIDGLGGPRMGGFGGSKNKNQFFYFILTPSSYLKFNALTKSILFDLYNKLLTKYVL